MKKRKKLFFEDVKIDWRSRLPTSTQKSSAKVLRSEIFDWIQKYLVKRDGWKVENLKFFFQLMPEVKFPITISDFNNFHDESFNLTFRDAEKKEYTLGKNAVYGRFNTQDDGYGRNFVVQRLHERINEKCEAMVTYIFRVSEETSKIAIKRVSIMPYNVRDEIYFSADIFYEEQTRVVMNMPKSILTVEYTNQDNMEFDRNIFQYLLSILTEECVDDVFDVASKVYQLLKGTENVELDLMVKSE